MNTNRLKILGISLIAFFSLFVLSSCGGSTATEAQILEVKSSDLIRGPENAPVTLIEYSDFQCPVCAAYHPLIEQIGKNNPTKFRLVYRFFPIVGSHANALPSAKAAQAAAMQGKFWEMSNLIFTNQKNWQDLPDTKPTFQGYAQQLGLDVPKFLQDMESQTVADRVKVNYDEASALNLPGTPSFFLNGKALKVTYDAFPGYIQSIIDKAEIGGGTSETQSIQ